MDGVVRAPLAQRPFQFFHEDAVAAEGGERAVEIAVAFGRDLQDGRNEPVLSERCHHVARLPHRERARSRRADEVRERNRLRCCRGALEFGVRGLDFVFDGARVHRRERVEIALGKLSQNASALRDRHDGFGIVAGAAER